jgi:hypothetical protein
MASTPAAVVVTVTGDARAGARNRAIRALPSAVAGAFSDQRGVNPLVMGLVAVLSASPVFVLGIGCFTSFDPEDLRASRGVGKVGALCR